MNFISSEQLIARVSKQLNSFQSSGLLDEGDFYRWIKEVLGMLNVPAYSPVHTIQSIDDNKMLIPDDMDQLWSIWRYEEKNENYNDEFHLQRTHRKPVLKDYCTTCEDECKIIHCEDIIETKYYVHEKAYKKQYHGGQLLHLKNYKVDKCLKDSISIRNNNSLEVTMDSNYFYFNFEGGAIYLQYYAYQLDENGLPMIPDVVKIERAIETYIIYRFFQELYWNGTIDALQRMQVAEQSYNMSFAIARAWVKLPSFNTLVDFALQRKNRYK